MIDMSMIEINYGAVVVAAVAYMAIGMLWYSPVLFGNMWLKESGKTQADMDAAKAKGMSMTMVIALINALVMSYVLAHVLDLIGATEFTEALSTGFWLWLGLVMTVQVHSVLWEGRSWKFFLINTVNSLVSILVMSIILVLWT